METGFRSSNIRFDFHFGSVDDHGFVPKSPSSTDHLSSSQPTTVERDPEEGSRSSGSNT